MSFIIRARNLALGYENSVISGVSFDFESEDFVIISGKSGSGKSTLLRSFYGDLSPKSGLLEVYNVSMRGISTSKLLRLRQNMGVIFQDYKLIAEYSIAQNIMLPLVIQGYNKKSCEQQATKLLKHIDLSFKADKKPAQLSGGEQQRVALARALACNPKLLLCDEPTGNLDEYSSDLVWTLLKSANELFKTCVVVVTHKIPNNLRLDFRLFNIQNGAMNEIA